jgi:hypothetical protein
MRSPASGNSKYRFKVLIFFLKIADSFVLYY